MIFVLIDTNVVMDYAEEREGFFETAKRVFEAIIQKKVVGCVSASAVTDIFYFLQKRYKEPGVAISLLKKLVRLLKILTVDREIIELAFATGMPDFEDAVQTAAAKDYNVNIIVTRDEEGFNNSGLQVYSPEEFLDTLK